MVEATGGKPHRVVFRSYPEAVLLWPTAAAALGSGLWTLALPAGASGGAVGFVFLGVLLLNVLVLSLDVTRASFVALVSSIGFLLAAGVLAEQRFGVVTRAFVAVAGLQPAANHVFYLSVFAVIGVALAAVWARTRFDYWELHQNELLHHRGLFGDVERFGAQGLRWSKEIPDVFEYAVMRSGRLVLHVRERDRSIVLDHVFGVNALEREMERIQATVHVQVMPPSSEGSPPAP